MRFPVCSSRSETCLVGWEWCRYSGEWPKGLVDTLVEIPARQLGASLKTASPLRGLGGTLDELFHELLVLDETLHCAAPRTPLLALLG